MAPATPAATAASGNVRLVGRPSRGPYPWHYLAALVVPQAAISLFARALLTGVTAPLPLLRLGYWDMQIIAAYAIVSMVLVRQRRRSRLVMLSILALIAGVHCGLLLVNVIAVSFLLTPLTYQWLLYADFFRSITPWQAVSSTISASGIAKLLLALILPSLCVAAIAFVSRKVAYWLAFGSLACVALVIGGSLVLNFRDPPGRSPEGDMASSPVGVLARTFMSSSASRLAALRGDGRTLDYRATAGSVNDKPVAAPQTSVLIVVLESVSYEAVAQDIDDLPNLRRLAGQGAWFDNAFVTDAQSTRTIFSLAFSRFPLFSVTPETKSLLNVHLTPMTLPFRQHGGETKLFMGSDLAFENVRALLDRQEFGPVADVSSIACGTRYVLSSGHLWTNGDYLPDACVFDAAGKWMTSRTGRYLAVVWTGSTHFPYHAAGPAGDPRIRYRRALRDADRQIGTLIARLQASGKPLPAIIVMGDHGEAFGNHGYNGHGNSIHDDEIHIPS